MSDRKLIFISWSGQNAKPVALKIKDVLALCFDGVQTFMSEDDIKSGTRGLTVIQEALAGSQTAIIVVTRDNVSSPWLNFEAGAISNRIGLDEIRVIPLLVNLDISEIPAGSPLNQFQARKLDDHGLRKVMSDIAIGLGVNEEIALKRSGDELGQLVEMARTVDSDLTKAPPTQSTNDMIREVLVTVRELTRQMTDGVPPRTPPWERTGPVELETLVRIPRVLFKSHGVQGVEISIDSGRVYFTDPFSDWSHSLPMAEAVDIKNLQRIAHQIQDHRKAAEAYTDRDPLSGPSTDTATPARSRGLSNAARSRAAARTSPRPGGLPEGSARGVPPADLQ